MKKIIGLFLTVALVLPGSIVSAAADQDIQNIESTAVDSNDVWKEVSPGTYVPKKDNISFDTLNKALNKIHDKEKMERQSLDVQVLKQQKLDDVVLGQDGVIASGTTGYLNVYGFNYVTVGADVNWSNYPTYSSWDYSVIGYSTPYFSQGMVHHEMTLTGAVVNWPPVQKIYTHESPYQPNNYAVSLTGHDYSYGIYVYASTYNSFTAAPTGTGNYHTFVH